MAYYDTDTTENVWGIVTDGTPVIRSWYEKLYDGKVESGLDSQKISTDWYYNHTYRSTDFADETTLYTIADASDLYGMARVVNKGVPFTKSQTVQLVENGDFALDKTIEWTPIGTNTYRFSGIFDGNGNTISGVNIDNATTANQGLFLRLAADGKVCNFTLDDSTFKVGAQSGCIVGSAQGSIASI